MEVVSKLSDTDLGRERALQRRETASLAGSRDKETFLRRERVGGEEGIKISLKEDSHHYYYYHYYYYYYYYYYYFYYYYYYHYHHHHHHHPFLLTCRHVAMIGGVSSPVLNGSTWLPSDSST